MSVAISNPISGLSWKTPVRLCTAADLPANTPRGAGRGKTLTADAVGALVVDGRAVAPDDRIAVTAYGGASSSVHDGVYYVVAPGSGSTSWILVRTLDCDGAGPPQQTPSGTAFTVADGDTYSGKILYLATLDPIAIDTTPLHFAAYASGGGGGSAGPADLPAFTGAVSGDSGGPTTAYLTPGGASSAIARKFQTSARQLTRLLVELLATAVDADITVTLMHNGSPSSLALTIPAGSPAGSYSATGAATFVDGDTYDVKTVVAVDPLSGTADLSVAVLP